MAKTEQDRHTHIAFLAPAARCNQACPLCAISEVYREPVQKSTLYPRDYARFVTELVNDGVRINSVNFLGYEVTLPESWPYVESAFTAAQGHGIRRTLVTNGMLLHKRRAEIEALDVQQLTVSLDGADASTNDKFRGLSGAFDATTTNLSRFLTSAPRFRSRTVVASCLYEEDNVASLLNMPRLLRTLSIESWLLSIALVPSDGRQGSVRQIPMIRALPWLHDLAARALEYEIKAHFVDLECCDLDGIPGLHVQRPGGLDTVYRLDPTGGVRTGQALMEVYDEHRVRRWRPGEISAAEALGLAPRSDTPPRANVA